MTILTHQKTLLHQVKLPDLNPPSCHFSHLHLCGPDQYVLDFRIQDTGLIMAYHVQGPFKNYPMKTHYQKKTF
jgi:hypothetical protein